MTRKQLKEKLNILIVARHYKYYSQDIDEIAAIMRMTPERIQEWMDTPEWLQCCAYWGNRPKLGDFGLAERVWSQLIEFDEHLYPSEFPDIPIANPFCVDGLCKEQIRARIAEERVWGNTPVKYEKQHLKGYYWWLYPNWDASIFSKVFARANMFGDLVVGTGEKTQLVCIKHGRLSMTRQVCDDVVVVTDKRLLVCL